LFEHFKILMSHGSKEFLFKGLNPKNP